MAKEIVGCQVDKQKKWKKKKDINHIFGQFLSIALSQGTWCIKLQVTIATLLFHATL